MSRIGTEVGRLRREKGMTKKQLGKLVGVSESFIDEAELGKRVLNDNLAARIFKVLGRETSDYGLYSMEPDVGAEESSSKVAKTAPKPVQQVWSDALGDILKAVPVYSYKMDRTIGTKQLPIISNKVEGCPRDKVFYLSIEDSDMTGFRIVKNDMALACITQNAENDGFFFIEYNGKRAVRQIKKLDGDKILLISNKGGLQAETATAKNIKVIARLVRLEITL